MSHSKDCWKVHDVMCESRDTNDFIDKKFNLINQALSI